MTRHRPPHRRPAEPINVIFLSRPVFELLCAGHDGFFVLFSYRPGSPQQALGPFRSVGEARDWAVEAGDREGVRIDWPSFRRWGDSW